VPIPLGIAVAAAFAIGFLYYLANRAVYYPSKYPEGFWDTQALLGPSDAWIEASDGVKLHGWWVERRQDGISTPDVVPRIIPGGTQPDGGREGSPFATLFLHGNAGNITNRAPRIQEIVAAGSSVLMLDYRGYGKSSGRPSEQGLYRDSEAGFVYLLGKGYRADQIILHGESLGTAVAIDLASRRPCAALILEAPFTSASDVAGTVLPFVGPLLVRSYNSLPKIRWIRVPKLFMHGDCDEVIPLRLGQELFAAAQGSKTFWVIPGAGHNDILETAGAEYRHRLNTFYESFPRTIR
jgi:pimeloyl-ACP methyl ester carboxylesterase